MAPPFSLALLAVKVAPDTARVPVPPLSMAPPSKGHSPLPVAVLAVNVEP